MTFQLLHDDVGWLLTAHFNAHQRDFLIKCLLDHSLCDPGINIPDSIHEAPTKPYIQEMARYNGNMDDCRT